MNDFNDGVYFTFFIYILYTFLFIFIIILLFIFYYYFYLFSLYIIYIFIFYILIFSRDFTFLAQLYGSLQEYLQFSLGKDWDDPSWLVDHGIQAAQGIQRKLYFIAVILFPRFSILNTLEEIVYYRYMNGDDITLYKKQYALYSK